MKKILGCLLLLVPCIAIAVLSYLEIGFLLTLVAFGITILFIAPIILGAQLLQ